MSNTPSRFIAPRGTTGYGVYTDGQNIILEFLYEPNYYENQNYDPEAGDSCENDTVFRFEGGEPHTRISLPVELAVGLGKALALLEKEGESNAQTK